MQIEIGKTYLIEVNDLEFGVNNIVGAAIQTMKNDLAIILYDDGWEISPYIARIYHIPNNLIGKKAWFISNKDVIDCINNK